MSSIFTCKLFGGALRHFAGAGGSHVSLGKFLSSEYAGAPEQR